jgi:hypothetical protein
VLTKPALSNRSNEPTRPMTFGSMRRLGVRSLAVTYRCHHETIINADRWPSAGVLPSLPLAIGRDGPFALLEGLARRNMEIFERAIALFLLFAQRDADKPASSSDDIHARK